jgi:hypothetical protein
MSTTSNAFVSYAHSDHFIAEAIDKELMRLAEKGRGKDSLFCFFDTKSIKPGQRWEPVITASIEKADWLVVIFTGEQSAYCGVEIGKFSLLNKLDTSSPVPDKRLICLYDVEMRDLPTVVRDYQCEKVSAVEGTSSGDSLGSADETTAWYVTPLAEFLKDFCLYKKLYAPQDREDPGEFKIDIALAAKRITRAFAKSKEDEEKEETPVQLGFQLVLASSEGRHLTKIPDEALVVGTSVTFDALGLNLPLSTTRAPRIKWGELREKIARANRTNVVPWMDKIEVDVIRAADGIAVTGDDVTFVTASGKVFRPILAHHVAYASGTREFSILLVQTMDRRFIGKRETSLLLTALILASRWRFTYFENWEDTKNKTFGIERPLADFQDSCRQLIYNIEWIENEAAQYGTANVDALVEAFGQDKKARIERFYNDWDKDKKDLMAKLPALNSSFTPETRQVARTAVLNFLETTQKENSDFLELCIQAYSQQLLSDLSRSTFDHQHVEPIPGGASPNG